ncbi:MAG: 1-acyl-sn-glycerol-3-phosphate acyltransferase [Crocinitomicaceae bacterium]|nr:1-acyl-sn-glycerol-3-phosphate acyltransferase [Crocinitomicaceae bacterium]MDP5010008.1 1-acyl-sn-glycerol-3-phosphate acyltransferase [Crocinitomicaceae bacterium]
MRLIYFILYFSLPYALRIFYRQVRTVNAPKEFLGGTIYVSNHPASFMDPLVIAALRNPIVFFMTRSDVFTPISRPLLWASHMLPIYRQHDGVDTKDKNMETFDKCKAVLKGGRNLLIFGEGFTDDTPIRRLKPVKKGAARIGFTTLESLNWSKKIYMAAVGNNYTEPNLMRSDVLISTSDKICLNDYKELYLSNPNKAISDVTKLIEKLMKDQITHVEDVNLTTFHEQIMMISRKGMNARSYDPSISLKSRWEFSRKLALWLNDQETLNEGLVALKNELDAYFKLIKKFKIADHYIYEKSEKNSVHRSVDLLKIILLFPLALLGFLHCGLIYFGVKRFVEKSFKRKVFWGSTKLILGVVLFGILNIPSIFLFEAYIYPSYLLGLVYYAFIGIYGFAAYQWVMSIKRFKEKGVINKADLSKFISKRKDLENKVSELLKEI